MNIPQPVLDKFYEGKATEFTRFGVNASVRVVSGPYAEKYGSIISLEMLRPVPKYLVEFSDSYEALVDENDLSAI